MREHKKSHLGIMGWAMFLAGAMSLGSCSSDETLESMEPKAITFGSVSMENHSRAAVDPSYGDNKLIDGFQVWGTVTGNAGTANIFNGATIERGSAAYGAAWTQKSGSAQYWIPTADYTFMAIANATDVTADAGIPTAIEFDLTYGSEDLILSNTVNVKTDASAEPTTGVNNNKCVPFEFTHLLSKVHFTFDGSATNVAKIEVTGHYGSGTYNIGGENQGWGSQATTTSQLSFGGIVTDNNGTTSQYARLIIPGEQTWTIKLYELKNKQYVQIGNTLTLDYTAANDNRNSGGFIFAPNTQYNINISLGVDMNLSVSVQDWEGVTIENNFANNVSVNRGDEIQWTTDGLPTITNNNVILTSGIATFTFKIAGPKGGTWNAVLVTQQGNPNAFNITPSQGKVGDVCTVTITTDGENNTRVANVAELRLVVRQGGKILPVDNLTYFGENNPLNGTNYLIVQNPTIN